MSGEYYPENREVAWEASRESDDQDVASDIPPYEDEGIVHKSMILFVGLLIVFIPVLALLISHSTGDSKVGVYYRITVPRSCLQLDADYPDIKLGGTVKVYDGSNSLLGVGRLEVQNTVGSGCVYSALFSIKIASDGKYEITAGNKYRGRITYSASDLVILQQGRTLVVSARLG